MQDSSIVALFAAYLVGAFLVLPVLGAAVQIYRDLRGARRNRANRCYSCNRTGVLLPVPHYKGNIYLYCRRCQIRQGNWSGLLLVVVLLLAMIMGVIWLVLH
jgi:hypothetical protein